MGLGYANSAILPYILLERFLTGAFVLLIVVTGWGAQTPQLAHAKQSMCIR